ncbi:hypothetical protein [Magnetospira sp. QH-2]|nr:hypothetical protein [Magnetospira sp. QH-2]
MMNNDSNKPRVPSAAKWWAAGGLILVAVLLYASIMYKIAHYGP